jgi:hypothetical protein
MTTASDTNLPFTQRRKAMTEPMLEDEADLRDWLSRISFKNTVLDFKWKFEYKRVRVVTQGEDAPDRFGFLVWVSFERPDTITGEVGRGRGRDEIIWLGTSMSGVVKTGWVLVELMVKHELMEGFNFDCARIFNPHNSVLDLARVQELHDERLGLK